MNSYPNKIEDLDSMEVYDELAQIRNTSLIQSKGLLGITGITTDGNYIAFPDSYQRGFQAELTPINVRPKVDFEFAGLASLTSDGHWNYTPAYEKGREIGRELKMMVMVEKMRKIDEENNGLKKTIHDLKNRLDDFIRGSKN